MANAPRGPSKNETGTAQKQRIPACSTHHQNFREMSARSSTRGTLRGVLVAATWPTTELNSMPSSAQDLPSSNQCATTESEPVGGLLSRSDSSEACHRKQP